MDQYVIGLQSPTFCTYVEAKTRQWATIQGSPAFKFGVYFGRTKRDPHIDLQDEDSGCGSGSQAPIAAWEFARPLLQLGQVGRRVFDPHLR